MKKISFLFSIFLIAALTGSCKKDPGKYPVTISMTDAIGPYDAVYIDLKEIELTGSDNNTVMLEVNTGTYNLLDFTNGKDTLIATGSLDVSVTRQIRLILGPDNSVVVNGISHPLSTPSAEQSGLKIQLHRTLQAGITYRILLDFDASRSIVALGNGNYQLKPVIRAIETATSGAIRGSIVPAGTAAFVTATSGLSYATNVSPGGEFILMGLPAGTYTLTVNPASPYHDYTQVDIPVITGTTTNIGTIILQ